MEENLSPEQEKQLRENDVLNEWLGESRFIARITVDIDDALAILASKRTTLEEKIISRELNALAASYGRILNIVHERLRESAAPDIEQIEAIRSFNFEVHQTVEKLLKALRYNLNYVEQYFEFNFSTKLQERAFATEADQLAKTLET